MSPEMQVITIHILFLGMAYLVFYPTLPVKSLATTMRYDLAVTLAIFLVTGLLFQGKGIAFNLILLDVNWWVFTLVTGILIELPLAWWFFRRHGIDLFTGPRDEEQD